MGKFPEARLRRLRKSPALRKMIRETQLETTDFVYPLFVTHGDGVCDPIAPMPGISQLSLDKLRREILEISGLGIPAVLLFGLPSKKDPEGTEAYQQDGIVQQAVKMIKETACELVVITDVCLCEYTDHGHCGIMSGSDVDNDRTLKLLAMTAESHAAAGADMVAPSAMMDGQVSAIRKSLDINGFIDVPIMSYSAKYASAFYGPFRVAADSTPQYGDRKAYQMDVSNSNEAIREIKSDIDEGADIVMVKPALAYLDVIAIAKRMFNHPVAAYNVSGEYSMVKAASQNGWIDEERIVQEILTSIKRAGADIIISYHAKEIARLLEL